MEIPLRKFGQTSVAKINDSKELRQILDDPWLESDCIIIKPNWVTTECAGYTEASTLRMFFEALDARFIITESYCLGRSMNLLGDGMNFSVDGNNVNWKWLMRGDGWKWLTDNSDWSWFKEDDHWKHLRKEEENFLIKYGFKDLFQEFDVDYINVTEEVWNGRVVDPRIIKKEVESGYIAVHDEKIYGFVPGKLYDLRGNTFVSLARLKQYATFTLKNMFGMFPEPMKPWWHGPSNSKIAKSIVDINKIYHSLFNVYGICEALKTTAVSNPDGKYGNAFTFNYDIVDGFRFIAYGRNLVSVDNILSKLTEGRVISVEEVNRKPLMLAEKELGTFDKDMLEHVKIIVGNWLF